MKSENLHKEHSYAYLQEPLTHENFSPTGPRLEDMFLRPAYFPLEIEGELIDLTMSYATSFEKMTVLSMTNGVKESMQVVNMTDYQKMVAFCYLIGKVMDYGN